MTSSTTRIIEPRAQTAPTSTRGHGRKRLPDDVLAEQVRRLAVSAAVGAGLWAYGLLMDTVIKPLAVGANVPQLNVMIEIAAIATSGLMFVYVRYAPHSLRVKTDTGLVYLIVNAVGVALLNASTKVPTPAALHLSWNTVGILVGSMILPATPRKMLAASMVAASMDPLGMWIAHLRGMAVPSVIDTFVLFMPNYACAVVAVLPSHVLHRLGRRLNQVREMGSYHLVELLGRGGMGEVWRGTHRLLKRSAAIKLIRPELLGAVGKGDAQIMLRRFEREAQATSALSSPHTIRVFDFGVTSDGTFYYVMELLTGRDMETLVREFGPVPAPRAVFLLRQVCHSLADAHARGLIHRDVTPANIYVCRMGLDYDFVKVLDFGLVKFDDRLRSAARRRQRSMRNTLMTAGETTGTPGFMAPEVITDEGRVDQRADVYAFGCVAYYLLTGSPVFEADTPMKMFVHHVQTAPVRPSERTEMPIPRDLDDLILACLEKDPLRRPENAQELLRMLARCGSARTWDNDAARGWWEKHLPDLTRPIPEDDATTPLTAGFQAA
jgi:serine/threonine-protein kinase